MSMFIRNTDSKYLTYNWQMTVYLYFYHFLKRHVGNCIMHACRSTSKVWEYVWAWNKYLKKLLEYYLNIYRSRNQWIMLDLKALVLDRIVYLWISFRFGSPSDRPLLNLSDPASRPLPHFFTGFFSSSCLCLDL